MPNRLKINIAAIKSAESTSNADGLFLDENGRTTDAEMQRLKRENPDLYDQLDRSTPNRLTDTQAEMVRGLKVTPLAPQRRVAGPTPAKPTPGWTERGTGASGANAGKVVSNLFDLLGRIGATGTVVAEGARGSLDEMRRTIPQNTTPTSRGLDAQRRTPEQVTLAKLLELVPNMGRELGRGASAVGKGLQRAAKEVVRNPDTTEPPLDVAQELFPDDIAAQIALGVLPGVPSLIGSAPALAKGTAKVMGKVFDKSQELGARLGIEGEGGFAQLRKGETPIEAFKETTRLAADTGLDTVIREEYRVRELNRKGPSGYNYNEVPELSSMRGKQYILERRRIKTDENGTVEQPWEIFNANDNVDKLIGEGLSNVRDITPATKRAQTALAESARKADELAAERIAQAEKKAADDKEEIFTLQGEAITKRMHEGGKETDLALLKEWNDAIAIHAKNGPLIRNLGTDAEFKQLYRDAYYAQTIPAKRKATKEFLRRFPEFIAKHSAPEPVPTTPVTAVPAKLSWDTDKLPPPKNWQEMTFTPEKHSGVKYPKTLPVIPIDETWAIQKNISDKGGITGYNILHIPTGHTANSGPLATGSPIGLPDWQRIRLMAKAILRLSPETRAFPAGASQDQFKQLAREFLDAQMDEIKAAGITVPDDVMSRFENQQRYFRASDAGKAFINRKVVEATTPVDDVPAKVVDDAPVEPPATTEDVRRIKSAKSSYPKGYRDFAASIGTTTADLTDNAKEIIRRVVSNTPFKMRFDQFVRGQDFPYKAKLYEWAKRTNPEFTGLESLAPRSRVISDNPITQRTNRMGVATNQEVPIEKVESDYTKPEPPDKPHSYGQPVDPWTPDGEAVLEKAASPTTADDWVPFDPPAYGAYRGAIVDKQTEAANVGKLERQQNLFGKGKALGLTESDIVEVTEANIGRPLRFDSVANDELDSVIERMDEVKNTWSPEQKKIFLRDGIEPPDTGGPFTALLPNESDAAIPPGSMKPWEELKANWISAGETTLKKLGTGGTELKDRLLTKDRVYGRMVNEDKELILSLPDLSDAEDLAIQRFLDKNIDPGDERLREIGNAYRGWFDVKHRQSVEGGALKDEQRIEFYLPKFLDPALADNLGVKPMIENIIEEAAKKGKTLTTSQAQAILFRMSDNARGRKAGPLDFSRGHDDVGEDIFNHVLASDGTKQRLSMKELALQYSHSVNRRITEIQMFGRDDELIKGIGTTRATQQLARYNPEVANTYLQEYNRLLDEAIGSDPSLAVRGNLGNMQAARTEKIRQLKRVENWIERKRASDGTSLGPTLEEGRTAAKQHLEDVGTDTTGDRYSYHLGKAIPHEITGAILYNPASPEFKGYLNAEAQAAQMTYANTRLESLLPVQSRLQNELMMMNDKVADVLERDLKRASLKDLAADNTAGHKQAIADYMAEINANTPLQRIKREHGDVAHTVAEDIFDSFVGQNATQKRHDLSSPNSGPFLRIARNIASASYLTLASITNKTQPYVTVLPTLLRVPGAGGMSTFKDALVMNRQVRKLGGQEAGLLLETLSDQIAMIDRMPHNQNISPFLAKMEKRSRDLAKFVLNANRFTNVEIGNNLLASAAGRIHAGKLMGLVDGGGKWSEAAKKELVFLAGKGGFNEEHVVEAMGSSEGREYLQNVLAWSMPRATQFRSTALDMPLWANSELGRTWAQFKTFSGNMTRFVKESATRGTAAEKARFFSVFAPAAIGSAIVTDYIRRDIIGANVRKAVGVENRKRTTTEKAIDILGASGAFGLVTDSITRAADRGAQEMVIPPSASLPIKMGEDIVTQTFKGRPLHGLLSAAARPIGVIGNPIAEKIRDKETFTLHRILNKAKAALPNGSGTPRPGLKINTAKLNGIKTKTKTLKLNMKKLMPK